MNSTSDDENNDNDNGVTGTAVAVAGLAAIAAWGISKWYGSSKPEPKRHEQMTLSSLSSSSRGMRDQNRNENNTTFGQLTLESRKINSGNGNAKWTRPKKGCFKLNTDASARKQHGHTTGPATAGGVIRNDAGVWIMGFSSKLGVLDSNRAELEAVREGLRLAWEWGYSQMDLEVETDSEAAVKLINNLDLKNNHSMRLVVEECRDLLACLGTEIGHVYKEGNKCAHALAKIGIHPNKRLEVWKHVPNDHVRDVVKADMQLSLSPNVLR